MLSVRSKGKFLVVKLAGEGTDAGLEEGEELLDAKLESTGATNLLLDLRHYDGAAGLRTAWRELELARDFGDRLEKIAVVGILDWQKVAMELVSPFTHAKERFFEPSELGEAQAWLRE